MAAFSVAAFLLIFFCAAANFSAFAAAPLNMPSMPSAPTKSPTPVMLNPLSIFVSCVRSLFTALEASIFLILMSSCVAFRDFCMLFFSLCTSFSPPLNLIFLTSIVPLFTADWMLFNIFSPAFASTDTSFILMALPFVAEFTSFWISFCRALACDVSTPIFIFTPNAMCSPSSKKAATTSNRPSRRVYINLRCSPA